MMSKLKLLTLEDWIIYAMFIVGATLYAVSIW